MREHLEFEVYWIDYFGPKSYWAIRKLGQSGVVRVGVYKSDIKREIRAALFKQFGITNQVNIDELNASGVWRVDTVVNRVPA